MRGFHHLRPWVYEFCVETGSDFDALWDRIRDADQRSYGSLRSFLRGEVFPLAPALRGWLEANDKAGFRLSREVAALRAMTEDHPQGLSLRHRILRLHEIGLSYPDIARTVGVSRTTVWRLVTGGTVGAKA